MSSKWGVHWTYTISRGWVLDSTGTRVLAFDTEAEADKHAVGLTWEGGRVGGRDISKGKTYTAMRLTQALLDARLAGGTRGGRSWS